MKKIIFFCVLSLILLSGCTEPGLGGTASVQGTVRHHSVLIPDARVLIKFGATEFPGGSASDYDAQTLADSTGSYSFGELEKGSYYIYSMGYDAGISDSVFGGVSVRLSKGESKTLNIPVTE